MVYLENKWVYLDKKTSVFGKISECIWLDPWVYLENLWVYLECDECIWIYQWVYLARLGECIWNVRRHSNWVYLESSKYTHMDDYWRRTVPTGITEQYKTITRSWILHECKPTDLPSKSVFSWEPAVYESGKPANR